MRKLLTLAAVLVVLAGAIIGYILIGNRPKAEETKIDITQIVELDKAKLSRIELKRAGSTLTLVKDGGQWKLESGRPFDMDEVRTDDLASAVTSITARSVVEENPKDLAQYGLNPPQVTARAIFTDKTEKTYLLGNKTPANDNYYFQLQGDPKVYTVSSYINERYRYAAADFHKTAITPSIIPEEITYLKVRERDGTVIELQQKTSAESKMAYLGFGTYLMTKPYAYAVGVDGEKSATFISSSGNLSFSGFIADDVADLSRYGLAKPWGEILVRDKSNTLHLYLGADRDENNVYAMYADKKSVFTIEKYALSFLDTKPFSIVDRFAFIPNIEHVDRVELVSGGKTHVMILTRSVKKAEKEGEEDETVTAYAVNGKNVEETYFKNYYQMLIGLITEGEIKAPVSGTPELKVRYYFNTGALKQADILYIPYNKDFYSISVNGKQSFAISKTQVSAMLKGLDRLLAGENPKETDDTIVF